MTCASCANRIERKLNKLDGVIAEVNYATERARVSYPATVSTDDLLATVAAAGYAATLPGAEPATADDEDEAGDPELDALRQRLVVSALLTVPVVAAGDGAGAAVRRLAVGLAHPGRARGGVGRLAVPPRRRWSTCATAPRRWTRWSRSACWRRSAGRWSPSSSAPPARSG